MILCLAFSAFLFGCLVGGYIVNMYDRELMYSIMFANHAYPTYDLPVFLVAKDVK